MADSEKKSAAELSKRKRNAAIIVGVVAAVVIGVVAGILAWKLWPQQQSVDYIIEQPNPQVAYFQGVQSDIESSGGCLPISGQLLLNASLSATINDAFGTSTLNLCAATATYMNGTTVVSGKANLLGGGNVSCIVTLVPNEVTTVQGGGLTNYTQITSVSMLLQAYPASSKWNFSSSAPVRHYTQTVAEDLGALPLNDVALLFAAYAGSYTLANTRPMRSLPNNSVVLEAGLSLFATTPVGSFPALRELYAANGASDQSLIALAGQLTPTSVSLTSSLLSNATLSSLATLRSWTLSVGTTEPAFTLSGWMTFQMGRGQSLGANFEGNFVGPSIAVVSDQTTSLWNLPIGSSGGMMVSDAQMDVTWTAGDSSRRRRDDTNEDTVTGALRGWTTIANASLSVDFKFGPEPANAPPALDSCVPFDFAVKNGSLTLAQIVDALTSRQTREASKGNNTLLDLAIWHSPLTEVTMTVSPGCNESTVFGVIVDNTVLGTAQVQLAVGNLVAAADVLHATNKFISNNGTLANLSAHLDGVEVTVTELNNVVQRTYRGDPYPQHYAHDVPDVNYTSAMPIHVRVNATAGQAGLFGPTYRDISIANVSLVHVVTKDGNGAWVRWADAVRALSHALLGANLTVVPMSSMPMVNSFVSIVTPISNTWGIGSVPGAPSGFLSFPNYKPIVLVSPARFFHYTTNATSTIQRVPFLVRPGTSYAAKATFTGPVEMQLVGNFAVSSPLHELDMFGMIDDAWSYAFVFPDRLTFNSDETTFENFTVTVVGNKTNGALAYSAASVSVIAINGLPSITFWTTGPINNFTMGLMGASFNASWLAPVGRDGIPLMSEGPGVMRLAYDGASSSLGGTIRAVTTIVYTNVNYSLSLPTNSLNGNCPSAFIDDPSLIAATVEDFVNFYAWSDAANKTLVLDTVRDGILLAPIIPSSVRFRPTCQSLELWGTTSSDIVGEMADYRLTVAKFEGVASFLNRLNASMATLKLDRTPIRVDGASASNSTGDSFVISTLIGSILQSWLEMDFPEHVRVARYAVTESLDEMVGSISAMSLVTANLKQVASLKAMIRGLQTAITAWGAENVMALNDYMSPPPAKGLWNLQVEAVPPVGWDMASVPPLASDSLQLKVEFPLFVYTTVSSTYDYNNVTFNRRAWSPISNYTYQVGVVFAGLNFAAVLPLFEVPDARAENIGVMLQVQSIVVTALINETAFPYEAMLRTSVLLTPHVHMLDPTLLIRPHPKPPQPEYEMSGRLRMQSNGMPLLDFVMSGPMRETGAYLDGYLLDDKVIPTGANGIVLPSFNSTTQFVWGATVANITLWNATFSSPFNGSYVLLTTNIYHGVFVDQDNLTIIGTAPSQEPGFALTLGHLSEQLSTRSPMSVDVNPGLYARLYDAPYRDYAMRILPAFGTVEFNGSYSASDSPNLAGDAAVRATVQQQLYGPEVLHQMSAGIANTAADITFVPGSTVSVHFSTAIDAILAVLDGPEDHLGLYNPAFALPPFPGGMRTQSLQAMFATVSTVMNAALNGTGLVVVVGGSEFPVGQLLLNMNGVFSAPKAGPLASYRPTMWGAWSVRQQTIPNAGFAFVGAQFAMPYFPNVSMSAPSFVYASAPCTFFFKTPANNAPIPDFAPQVKAGLTVVSTLNAEGAVQANAFTDLMAQSAVSTFDMRSTGLLATSPLFSNWQVGSVLRPTIAVSMYYWTLQFDEVGDFTALGWFNASVGEPPFRGQDIAFTFKATVSPFDIAFSAKHVEPPQPTNAGGVNGSINAAALPVLQIGDKGVTFIYGNFSSVWTAANSSLSSTTGTFRVAIGSVVYELGALNDDEGLNLAANGTRQDSPNVCAGVPNGGCPKKTVCVEDLVQNTTWCQPEWPCLNNGHCGNMLENECYVVNGTTNGTLEARCRSRNLCVTQPGYCGDPTRYYCHGSSTPSCSGIPQVVLAIAAGSSCNVSSWTQTGLQSTMVAILSKTPAGNLTTVSYVAEVENCTASYRGVLKNPGGDRSPLETVLAAFSALNATLLTRALGVTVTNVQSFKMTPTDLCSSEHNTCVEGVSYCMNIAGILNTINTTCAPYDECQFANGGCGDPALYSCISNINQPPTCIDNYPSFSPSYVESKLLNPGSFTSLSMDKNLYNTIAGAMVLNSSLAVDFRSAKLRMKGDAWLPAFNKRVSFDTRVDPCVSCFLGSNTTVIGTNGTSISTTKAPENWYVEYGLYFGEQWSDFPSFFPALKGVPLDSVSAVASSMSRRVVPLFPSPCTTWPYPNGCDLSPGLSLWGFVSLTKDSGASWQLRQVDTWTGVAHTPFQSLKVKNVTIAPLISILPTASFDLFGGYSVLPRSMWISTSTGKPVYSVVAWNATATFSNSPNSTVVTDVGTVWFGDENNDGVGFTSGALQNWTNVFNHPNIFGYNTNISTVAKGAYNGPDTQFTFNGMTSGKYADKGAGYFSIGPYSEGFFNIVYKAPSLTGTAILVANTKYVPMGNLLPIAYNIVLNGTNFVRTVGNSTFLDGTVTVAAPEIPVGSTEMGYDGGIVLEGAFELYSQSGNARVSIDPPNRILVNGTFEKMSFGNSTTYLEFKDDGDNCYNCRAEHFCKKNYISLALSIGNKTDDNYLDACNAQVQNLPLGSAGQVFSKATLMFTDMNLTVTIPFVSSNPKMEYDVVLVSTGGQLASIPDFTVVANIDEDQLTYLVDTVDDEYGNATAAMKTKMEYFYNLMISTNDTLTAQLQAIAGTQATDMTDLMTQKQYNGLQNLTSIYTAAYFYNQGVGRMKQYESVVSSSPIYQPNSAQLLDYFYNKLMLSNGTCVSVLNATLQMINGTAQTVAGLSQQISAAQNQLGNNGDISIFGYSIPEAVWNPSASGSPVYDANNEIGQLLTTIMFANLTFYDIGQYVPAVEQLNLILTKKADVKATTELVNATGYSNRVMANGYNATFDCDTPANLTANSTQYGTNPGTPSNPGASLSASNPTHMNAMLARRYAHRGVKPIDEKTHADGRIKVFQYTFDKQHPLFSQEKYDSCVDAHLSKVQRGLDVVNKKYGTSHVVSDESRSKADSSCTQQSVAQQVLQVCTGGLERKVSNRKVEQDLWRISFPDNKYPDVIVTRNKTISKDFVALGMRDSVWSSTLSRLQSGWLPQLSLVIVFLSQGYTLPLTVDPGAFEKLSANVFISLFQQYGSYDYYGATAGTASTSGSSSSSSRRRRSSNKK